MCNESKLSTFFVYLAPGNSPRNITVANKSSRELNLTWHPPEQSYGVITSYTIQISFTNDTDPINRTSSVTSLSITHLLPYQTINVMILATNSKGSGNFSLEKSFVTSEESKAIHIMKILQRVISEYEIILCLVLLNTQSQIL